MNVFSWGTDACRTIFIVNTWNIDIFICINSSTMQNEIQKQNEDTYRTEQVSLKIVLANIISLQFHSCLLGWFHVTFDKLLYWILTN